MQEKIINGVNYRLNDCTKTAEVTEQYGGYEGAIVIPETVVCNELTYRVTSIGKEAFAFCNPLISITIPDSVKRIGWKAFLDCESLEEIIIGNSVKSIGRRAFDGCDSLLSITYQGTIAQWKKIKLGYFWKTPIPTAVLHCTDGDVKV
jgi:hypothetical protein